MGCNNATQSRLCAFSSICEEDSIWINQYLAEVERLNLPFMMHFDRCTPETKSRIQRHPNCASSTEQNNPNKEFDERHKQPMMDLLHASEFEWAMAWDLDETYERGASEKISQILDLDAEEVDIIWYNLWNSPEFIRVDRHYECGHRAKFYRLVNTNGTKRRWKFDSPITNGAKSPGVYRTVKFPLVCLHWGMMTEELRQQHKDRWDRIYTTAVGGNPYGFWKDAVDPMITPQLIRNTYL